MTPQLVTGTPAADFLTSPNTRYLLGPFMDEARSMAEAAELLGMKLPALYRRVRQMVALGLLELTHEEVRAGHRIKFYRTTSREFIVPFESTSSATLETSLEGGFSGSAAMLSRGVAKEMQRQTPRWGVRIFWLGGAFQQTVPLSVQGEVLELDQRRSIYGDCGLRLTPGDARAFGDELQTLYEKYLALGKPEGAWHFLFVGFTPL